MGEGGAGDGDDPGRKDDGAGGGTSDTTKEASTDPATNAPATNARDSERRERDVDAASPASSEAMSVHTEEPPDSDDEFSLSAVGRRAGSGLSRSSSSRMSMRGSGDAQEFQFPAPRKRDTTEWPSMPKPKEGKRVPREALERFHKSMTESDAPQDRQFVAANKQRMDSYVQGPRRRFEQKQAEIAAEEAARQEAAEAKAEADRLAAALGMPTSANEDGEDDEEDSGAGRGRGEGGGKKTKGERLKHDIHNSTVTFSRDSTDTGELSDFDSPRSTASAAVPSVVRRGRIPGTYRYEAQGTRTDIANILAASKRRAPDTDRGLGPRSRFGDGDGSFWDRWMNPTGNHPGYMPKMSSLLQGYGVPSSGFKRFAAGQEPDAAVKQIKGYSARKAEEAAKRAEEQDRRRKIAVSPIHRSRSIGIAAGKAAAAAATATEDMAQNLADGHGPTRPGIDRQDSGFERPHRHSISVLLMPQRHPSMILEEHRRQERDETEVAGAGVKLPPLSQQDREDYFGVAARQSFFQYYKQLGQRVHFTETGKLADMLPPEEEDEDEAAARMKGRRGSASRGSSQGGGGSGGGGTSSGESSAATSRNSSRMGAQPGGSPLSAEDALLAARQAILAGPKEEVPQGSELLKTPSGEDLLVHRPAGAEPTFRRPSARTHYLVGCHDRQILPLPSLLIRKEENSTINLSHCSVGDTMAAVLERALPRLPHVKRILAADNRLSDVGVSCLVRSARRCQYLVYLDLSQNKVDGDAAVSLAKFLALPTCQLEVLILRNADINDEECRLFVDALHTNQHLRELDLANNKIGSDESLNDVQPDLVTGGEALAEYLGSPRCTLRVLNLSWNTLRANSAVELAESLAFNKSLRSVNFTYNSFGRFGGLELAASLYSNTTLEALHIAHNSIPSDAAFAIGVATRYNKSLRSLAMDGNPIGDVGARKLMSVPVEFGDRLRLTARDCNTKVADPNSWFDPVLPNGTHTLELSKPYERAVALELLHLASLQIGITIDECVEKPPENVGGPETELQFRAFEVRREEREEWRNIMRDDVVDIASALFDRYDQDGSGSVDKHELEAVLADLGMRVDSDHVRKVMSLYDTDRSGHIERAEFLDFITHKRHEAHALMVRSRYLALASARPNPETGLPDPYVFPTIGSVRMTVSYHRTQPDQPRPATQEEISFMIDAVREMTHATSMMEYSLAHVEVNATQAQQILDALGREDVDRAACMAKILPRVLNPRDARMLVATNLRSDAERIRLRRLLTPLYEPIMGLFAGHYTLDLAKEMHMLCLHRLVEISSMQQRQRVAAGLADLSQKGNMHCFRNEMFNGKPVTVDTTFVDPTPSQGTLVFDFVSFENIADSSLEPVSNTRMAKILVDSGIISSDAATKTSVEEELAGLPSFKRMTGCKWEWSEEYAERVDQTLTYLYREQEKDLPEANGGTGDEEGGEGGDEEAAAAAAAKSGGGFDESSAAANQLAKDGGSGASATLGLDKDPASMSESSRALMFRNASMHSMMSFEDTASEMSLVSGGSMTNLWREAVESGADPDVVVPYDKPPSLPRRGPPSLYPFVEQFEQAYKDELKQAKEGARGLGQQKTLHNAERNRNLVAQHRKLTALSDAMCARTLTVTHLVAVVRRMRADLDWMAPGVGTARVEAIIMLMDRLVDKHNMDHICRYLYPEETAALIYRVGYLSLFNPAKPDGHIKLRMYRREERLLAKIFVHLAVVEPGENWLDETFAWQPNSEPVAGWELPVTWFTESGMPSKGVLALQYYSGEGKGKQGCHPNIACRSLLRLLVISDHPLYLDAVTPSNRLLGLADADSALKECGLNFTYTSSSYRPMSPRAT